MARNHHHDDTSPPMPEIEGYRLLRVINHGGMSTVYLAEQLTLGREVAVKVMAPQALADEVSRRRFENEVRTIARLEHPHVVRIYELGRTRDGLPYYSMPHLARGHLGQRDYSRNEARVRQIAQALMSALEYAHARGFVHRDVKAENVLFDDAERPLLADFGIAVRRGFGPRVTAAGLAVGSTAYMAPEQARGEEVDGRADLYSLGVLIWEMLAGGLPFQAGDALSMAVMHAQNPIPKLPPHLSHWQRFMNRALAKHPGQRFQDVAEMRLAMSQVRRRHIAPWLGWLRDAAANHLSRARIAALAVMVVAVTALVLVYGSFRKHDFFRAPPAPVPVQAADADPTGAMLEPLPEAPLQALLDTARQQIAQRQLIAPDSGNAYASVLEAWHADSTSPLVQQAVGELTGAFESEVLRNLEAGKPERADEYFQRATTLGQQTGNADTPAQRRLRQKAAATLESQFDRAAKAYDRKRAEQLATLAGQWQLAPAVVSRLATQAKALPRPGESVPGEPSRGVLSKGTDGAVVIARKPVSRGEYARFASASGRKGAICRERVSLLRVLAPRDWKSPGFAQSDADPVVCVSMADAEAYAQWYSQKSGHRYRLPTSTEAQQTAPENSGRAVALWLRDCGSNCQQRMAAGSSWRSKQGQRPLPASRGYDDVGFRLVREL